MTLLYNISPQRAKQRCRKDTAVVRGHRLDRPRSWALETQQRVGHNKATLALANKLARIVWATWKYERAFDVDLPPVRWTLCSKHPRSGNKC